MPRTTRLAPAALAGALLVALTGCSSGVTVAGRPTSLTSAKEATYAPHTPRLRTPTPSPTPTEDRRTAPGPELAYRTPTGAALLHVQTYSWQRTKFGDRSVPPTNLYLVLDVEVTATEGQVEVLPVNFKTSAQGGPLTEPALGRDGNEPTLAHTQLKAGNTVRGFVVFDLPQAEVTLTVLDDVGEKAGEVKIPAQ